MPMPGLPGAPADLGLGDMLGQQVADETEEERKRRQLGLSRNMGIAPLNFGMTGVAAADLGVLGAGRR